MSASSIDAGAEAALQQALRRRFGARCRIDAPGRRLYGYDAMGTEFAVPCAVVQVESAAEAAECLGIAAAHGGKLVARGSGTGLSGGSVPHGGAVVVSFERMRGVQGLDPIARTLQAEPGVVNGSLEARLRPHGLFYPPDPASYRVSTIGGNIAENAGGPHAVKYGVTGQHVQALQVVDAAGRSGWLHAGAVQPGADLVALVTGSEGTLALVTAAELTLDPRPAEVATLLLSFRDMDGATDYVSAAVAAGLLPATLEFMDRQTIEAVEAWGVAHYPDGAGAVLLMEIDGSPQEVAQGLALAQELAQGSAAIGVEAATDPAARDALWLGRRGSYAALARHGRRVLTQDVTVPRARLTEMLREVSRIAEHYGLKVATVGHVGDGNLHPDFAYDPDDPEESLRVHAANDEVIAACVRLGGSITGEHGIGTDKLRGMPVMFSPAELGLMAAVRGAFDPSGMLNPGKAVPMALRTAKEPAGGAAPKLPASAQDLQAALLAAGAAGNPARISLAGLRGIAIDTQSLTAEVGAGEPIEAIEAALAKTPFTFGCRPLRAATIGEALLANDYGAEHLGLGTLRAHLLGVTYVTGAGELVRFGRAVVKNVAGYDLFRLLIGSRGRLGLPASLILRLLPRRTAPWWQARGEIGELRAQASRTHALFAVPQEGHYAVYAQAPEPPPGQWREAPGAQAALSALRAELREEGDLLDLSMAPRDLGQALSRLGSEPRIVLPAAARLLVRLPQGRARELSEELAALGPVRADYGEERAPLASPPALAAAWEERLRAVFDPKGILAESLGGAGR